MKKITIPNKVYFELKYGKEFVNDVWHYATEEAMAKFRKGELRSNPIWYIAAILESKYKERQKNSEECKVSRKPKTPSWVERYRKMIKGDDNA